MFIITDRLRTLLNKAIENKGGVEQAVGFFGSKRSTIYRWLKGETKTVNGHIFDRILGLVEPYMEKSEYDECASKLNAHKTPCVSIKTDDTTWNVLSEIWVDLPQLDREKLLLKALQMKKRNRKKKA